jgi:hypothetical protein
MVYVCSLLCTLCDFDINEKFFFFFLYGLCFALYVSSANEKQREKLHFLGKLMEI